MRTLLLTLVASCLLAGEALPQAPSRTADKDADQQQANAVAAYVGDGKIQHVFYRGPDSAIYELYHKPGGEARGWIRNNLTAEAKAPPAESAPCAYYFKYDKSHHVVYRGPDGQIHELYRSQDAPWRHMNLTSGTKAPKAVGNPGSYAKESDNSQHVVFRTADGGICELFRGADRDKTWQLNDLTAAAKAPKAAGDPCGYMVKEGNTQHVVFRTTDGAICELFHDPKGQWMNKDLTTEAGAPKAAGDPCGYFMDDDDTQHVVYRTADGAICELYQKLEAGSRWRFNNLTAEAGAPKAAGDPCGYVVKDGDSSHVLYRGTEGQVHELYRNPKSKWAHKDLVVEAGGPKAAGNPVGYFKDADDTQHVFFRSSDGGICELFRKLEATGKWRSNTLTAADKPR